MKIRELTQKAENLIEQGENAKQRQIHYQQQANSARVQVMSAYARLEAAASETDEEGNPIGDVSGARDEVYAAQALLESAEVNLAEANQQLEIVGRRKLDAVHEIERYENVEESNMSKLAELQKKRFGANANAFMADLAARMNSGEQARIQLLSSMGIVTSAKTFSASHAIGNVGSYSNAANQTTEETDDSVTSIFGKMFQRKPKHRRNIAQLSSANTPYPTKYTSVDELSEDVYVAAQHYQENHEKYNPVMRQGGTSEDIKRLKSIISEHKIAEDTVFFRRASLKDLGKELENCPLSDLVGKRYQFQGIMSVAKNGNDKMASDDVVFKVIAPKGTPGLDLTDVGFFQEAMFDSPLCYIEKAEMTGYNTPCITVRVFSSKQYHNIVDELKGNGVHHNPIQEFGRERSSEEIADRISGGDLTEGSCSSLALAFTGNEIGYDVLDFRDGNSREYFSRRSSIEKIANLPGVTSLIEYGSDDVTCVSKLLQSTENGKNYYLATGGHAAVIRQNNDHFEYLELQHPGRGNGWHSLDESVLINRFGCSSNRHHDNSSFLIDANSLAHSQEFLDILGYINTNNYGQRKGSAGNVK